MKFYTGVGSRETPKDILLLVTEVASALAFRGWTLRSGGADGADTAFEDGAENKKVIYLPWKGYNNRKGILLSDDSEKVKWASELASKIHPAWDKCSRGAQALHSRNIFQVLGHEEEINPSTFLICYAQTVGDSVKGGTRTAVECAKMFDVPTYNLFVEKDRQKIIKFLKG